nr:hypothetical protein [uncultured Desulfovibrio sp.]
MSEPTRRSITLESLETLPKTACVGCPNSVWHIVRDEKAKKDQVQVFCQLMHALIDKPMLVCDGTQIVPQEKSAC